MSGAFQLADLGAAQFVLIGAVAFAASILGGLAGYGTGLVLPIFLAPAVGVANVVPVMAVAMILNNGSRVAAFWRDIHWPHARRILAFGLPACVAGAYGYTLLEARWVALLLGAFFIVSVPLRRILQHAGWKLGERGVAAAGAGFGLVNGGMTGAGLLLISTLMAAGLLIGLATVPGAFVARWLMAHIPLKVHTLLMEAVVLIGGAGFLWRAFA